MIRIIKYVISFIIFFAFFYTDSALNIPVFSHAWKAVFVIFVIVYLLTHGTVSPPAFIKIRAVWSVQQTINASSLLGDIMFNVLLAVRWAMIIFLYAFFERKYYKKEYKLYDLLITISQFFALSCIPFLLGLIEQTASDEVIGDKIGFSGIFGAVHATAAVMSIVSVVLLYHIKNHKLGVIQYAYNILLTAVSMIATYQAYTRTGWVMLIIGLLVLYVPSKLKFKHIIAYAFLLTVIGVTVISLYNNVEMFRYRVEDINPDTDEQVLRGSGRNLYRITSLKLWLEGNTSEKILGCGLNRLMDNMQATVGERLFSHNGYIDALTANGVIGLTLMLLYIVAIFVFLIKQKESPYSRLGFVILIQYISYQATQGSNLFQIDLMYALIYSLISIDGRRLLRLKNTK